MDESFVWGTPKDESAGPSRRDMLRRTAMVGAGVVWTTPVVQSLSGPALATGGSPPGGGDCFGCLTGGGQLIVGGTVNGGQADVSFGLSPICCGENQPGTELEVNVPGTSDQWHFDQNLVVRCTVDASCSAGQPASCANVFTGTIEDADGNVLSFSFTDCGEPGTDVDKVSLAITAAGEQTPFLTAAGTLDRGNLQAHLDLGGNPDGMPAPTRECNCS
jgi:hypothetical protein